MLSSPRRNRLAALLLICLPPLLLAASATQLLDSAGHPLAHFPEPGTRILVLVFGATDCPISNRYVPEVDRLAKEFSPRHVDIRWVFSNPDDTPEVVRNHIADFSIATPSILDPQQELVKQAGVFVTPEAAVFAVDGPNLRELYHGRLDDRYIAFGRERPQANHHELQEAIVAALAGKPAPQPGGSPVGCSIVPRT